MIDSQQPISNVSELIAGIRKGLVPRAVRLFAARGLLPVGREELIRLLILLAVEGDEEIASTARTTLADFRVVHFAAVLELPDLESLEIDLLARSQSDESIWQKVVRDSRTANETLRWLAANAPARTLDAIVTNQTRLLSCLELVSDLRGNSHVTQDILRRLKEFEEEFLAKATRWATAAGSEPEIEHGPTIEEALASLKELGMRVSTEESQAPQLPEPESGAAPEIRDAFVRLSLMSTYDRIMRALKGSREERLILVRDRSSLIVRAVMASPKLTEADVELMAAMRSVNEEVPRMIFQSRRWMRRYGVVRNLVFNAKTPPSIATALVRRLNDKDLSRLSRDRNVSEAVRRAARTYRDRSSGRSMG